MMRLVQADPAILFSLYRSTRGGFWLTRHIDEAVLQNYYRPDAPVDAWAAPIPGVLACGHEVVMLLGDELIPEPSLVRTEFHHNTLVPLAIRHLMGTPKRLDRRRPDLDVALSLYRSSRQPRFDDASRALLRPLIRPLHRALYLAATLSDAQHRVRTAEAPLAVIGDGVLLPTRPASGS